MFDSALVLPTLLTLVPIAGGLIAMSMVTRRAAGVTAVVTFAIHAALIALATTALDGTSKHLLLELRRDWFPLWNIEYFVRLDAPALGLIALTSVVTFSASLFAWYADRERPAPFQGLLWLTAGALCGLFVARDLVLFYVFFELMLVPLLFLVGGWGGAERIRATLTMFIYTLVGSLLMLVGVIGVGSRAGTFDLVLLAQQAEQGTAGIFEWWMFASFVIAFAVKAPLLPFHGWLPLTYREAPAEVTAVLSGLVSKAAFFGFLLVVLPLFPYYMDDGRFGLVIVWAAIAGLLYGSVTAFRQPDARGVLAYSSLAQMGLIVLGLAVYLGDGGTQALSGAYMQTINHGLVSAAFFLLVGFVELRAGTGLLRRLGGFATDRPVLASVALVITMCALAVPGSNTFAGEVMILVGAFQSSWVYAAVGSSAIVLAAMYALRLVSAVNHTEHDPAVTATDRTLHHAHKEPAGHVHTTTATPTATANAGPAAAPAFGPDLRWPEVVTLAPLVAGILLLSAWPNALRDSMNERPVPTIHGGSAVEFAAAGEPSAGARSEHAGEGDAHR